jgi:glycosyltransferase involved in cell wall biosynthesis
MSGDFKNKYIIKFIKYFDTRACQDAFRIIVLSKDMKNNVQLRSGCRNKKILIIPNVPHYITSQLDDADKPEILTKNPSKFRIVYTGNIGRFQGLETIMEAMQNLDENIELIFLGNGVYQNKIIKNYSDLIGKSVIMLPSNDINYVNSLINSADIGLVSLLDGVEKCAFPSKMSGYLNMNCPILVIASKGSEIYKMTSDYKIGISVDHSDPKKVSDLISKISTTNDFKISYKSSIIKFMNKYYLKENIVNSWKNLLNNFDD